MQLKYGPLTNLMSVIPIGGQLRLEQLISPMPAWKTDDGDIYSIEFTIVVEKYIRY